MDLNVLRERLEGLSTEEQMGVFAILHNNHVQFSENSNGIFVNMSVLDRHILDELIVYVSRKKEQEELLDDAEKKKQEYMTQFYGKDEPEIEIKTSVVNVLETLVATEQVENIVQLKKRRGRKPKQN
jgi:hypothetical protein